MASPKFSEDVHPITELKTKTSGLIDHVNRSRRPVQALKEVTAPGRARRPRPADRPHRPGPALFPLRCRAAYPQHEKP